MPEPPCLAAVSSDCRLLVETSFPYRDDVAVGRSSGSCPPARRIPERPRLLRWLAEPVYAYRILAGFCSFAPCRQLSSFGQTASRVVMFCHMAPPRQHGGSWRGFVPIWWGPPPNCPTSSSKSAASGSTRLFVRTLARVALHRPPHAGSTCLPGG